MASSTTEVAARSPSYPSLLTSGAAPSYERHRPEKTALFTVVCEQLEPFLARAREGDHPAPRFIEQELRAYLRCRILAHGFLRLHCDACGQCGCADEVMQAELSWKWIPDNS